jgi:hypothetical protein
MDFLLYLSPENVEIYKMISKKIRVVENAPICRKHKIYGFFDTDKQTMFICTKQIVLDGSPTEYINETLLHETVHLSQACKGNMKEIKPFGLSKSTTPLSNRRETDLISATSISGKQIYSIEREAFWMEDKPEKVRYVLQKYCF